MPSLSDFRNEMALECLTSLTEASFFAAMPFDSSL